MYGIIVCGLIKPVLKDGINLLGLSYLIKLHKSRIVLTVLCKLEGKDCYIL